MINNESLQSKSLMDLLELLLAVNLNTKHTVVFGYMGHTNEVYIRFFEGGWVSGMEPTEVHRFYLDIDGWKEEVNELYVQYSEILNKDHKAGYDEECGF